MLLATASYLYAQQKPAANPAQPADSSQPAQRDYRFEVASIRPGDPNGRLSGPPGPSYTPGRFRTESNSLWGLAAMAFSKKQNFELECPQWMLTAHFTVNATLPEGATKADLPIMIQHLMEDRFALKYHHVTRQMAGYELVVAKPDPRLAKSATPDFDGATLRRPVFEMKDGEPQFAKDAGSADMCFGGGTGGCALHGRNRTMQTLAADLAQKLHVPVMDATGLEGGYDYTFIYTQEPMPMPGIVVSPGGGVPATTLPDGPLDHPLLRDALREQLGLELRPVKNVPVDVVVIDSANKVPTEN
jgi:uncharacterized protein (TIGR03435 family)